MGDPVGEDARLARAGPGDDEHGALGREHRLALLVVQHPQVLLGRQDGHAPDGNLPLLMVAVTFEAPMSAEQRADFARLVKEARSTRPEGVVQALLIASGDLVRLVAVWKDRDTLDRYLATTPVPRGTELMRKVGAEPEVTIGEVLELG